MTNETKPKLTEQERLAKMRAGREAAGKAVRVARNDVLLNTEEYINSPGFRQAHKSNSVIKRVFDDLAANRERYKVNPDGSRMTIEDEIAARSARGQDLSDRQRKHLGMLTKKEAKERAELLEAALKELSTEERAFYDALPPAKQQIFLELEEEERGYWMEDPEADEEAA